MHPRQRLLLSSALLLPFLFALADDDNKYKTVDNDLRGRNLGIRIAKSGKGKGAKGGKETSKNNHSSTAPHPTNNSKSEKSSSKSSKYDNNTYYIAPFSCTNQCLDANGADLGSGKLHHAVQRCSLHGMHGDTQKWMIHDSTHNNNDDDGSNMVQIESYVHHNKCIGIDYYADDTLSIVKDMCSNGVLKLVPCSDNPATYWYNGNGGNLISFFCWSKGISSTMSVEYDASDKICKEELTATEEDTVDSDVSSMGDTFMFVRSADMEVLYDPSHDKTPAYSPTMNPIVDDDEEEEDDLVPTEPPSLTPTTYLPTYFPTSSPTPAPITQGSNGRKSRPSNRGKIGPKRNNIGIWNNNNGPIEEKKNGGHGQNSNGSIVGEKMKDDDDIFTFQDGK